MTNYRDKAEEFIASCEAEGVRFYKENGEWCIEGAGNWAACIAYFLKDEIIEALGQRSGNPTLNLVVNNHKNPRRRGA